MGLKWFENRWAEDNWTGPKSIFIQRIRARGGRVGCGPRNEKIGPKVKTNASWAPVVPPTQQTKRVNSIHDYAGFLFPPLSYLGRTLQALHFIVRQIDSFLACNLPQPDHFSCTLIHEHVAVINAQSYCTWKLRTLLNTKKKKKEKKKVYCFLVD